MLSVVMTVILIVMVITLITIHIINIITPASMLKDRMWRSMSGPSRRVPDLGAKDSTPEINTSETIVDFQLVAFSNVFVFL